MGLAICRLLTLSANCRHWADGAEFAFARNRYSLPTPCYIQATTSSTVRRGGVYKLACCRLLSHLQHDVVFVHTPLLAGGMYKSAVTLGESL